MTIHIQHMTSLVRYFENDSDSYGAPYQWVGMATPTTKAWRELAKELRPLGVEEVIFKRIRDGQEKTHTVKL